MGARFHTAGRAEKRLWVAPSPLPVSCLDVRADGPRAELLGAGAPRRRRSLQFCVVENEDAFLPTDSRGTQNGWLVCVLRWRVFPGRKSLYAAHFVYGSPFASTVGDSLMKECIGGFCVN